MIILKNLFNKLCSPTNCFIVRHLYVNMYIVFLQVVVKKEDKKKS